jgi:hypothetical protein
MKEIIGREKSLLREISGRRKLNLVYKIEKK